MEERFPRLLVIFQSIFSKTDSCTWNKKRNAGGWVHSWDTGRERGGADSDEGDEHKRGPWRKRSSQINAAPGWSHACSLDDTKINICILKMLLQYIGHTWHIWLPAMRLCCSVEGESHTSFWVTYFRNTKLTVMNKTSRLKNLLWFSVLHNPTRFFFFF